jgi:lipopolysaccharide transport system permease protein
VSSSITATRPSSERIVSLLTLGHEAIAQVWRHRHLIRTLAARELSARFRGSAFGGLWAVLQPIALVAIFYYVLAVIFRARWSPTSTSDADFIIGIFTGLLVYGLFAETVSRSTGAVSGSPNYVKKIVFPITILPIVQLVFALVNFAIGLVVLLAFGLLSGAAALHLATPTLVLALLPVALWALGVGWFCAALNVYFRDTGVIVPLLLQALMFLSPVFYSFERVPETAKFWVGWSPLTIPISEAHDILMKGQAANLEALFAPTLVGLAVMVLGYAFFRKVKPGFADVL